jgi:hypothetical protein
MMYYLMFCIATAVLGLVFLVMPVLNYIRHKVKDIFGFWFCFRVLVTSFLIYIVLAPAVFITLLNKDHESRFKHNLLNVLSRKYT